MLLTNIRERSIAVLAVRRMSIVSRYQSHQQQLVGRMCDTFKPAFPKVMEDGSGGISLSKTIRTLTSEYRRRNRRGRFISIHSISMVVGIASRLALLKLV